MRIPNADPLRPGLILLDLNLPRLDGREVLAPIRPTTAPPAHPGGRAHTSEAEEDVLRSYDLHANAYVTKPVDFEQFVLTGRRHRRHRHRAGDGQFVKVVEGGAPVDDLYISVVRLPPLTTGHFPLTFRLLAWP